MRIIVAMTGATGAVYGVRLLAALGEMKIETHLVLSRWAEVTLRKETGLSPRELAATASVVHSREDQGASIASGSFRHDGMIIAPCSMKRSRGHPSRICRRTDCPCRRRHLEGAASPCSAGPGDTAQRNTSREHAGAEPHGSDHRAARARLLQQSRHHRRFDRSYRWPRPGSVRAGVAIAQAMEWLSPIHPGSWIVSQGGE
jgi:hypothetical protein